MRRYAIWIGVGLALVIALVFVGVGLAFRPYTLHGSVIQQPSAAPDFSLPLANGAATNGAATNGAATNGAATNGAFTLSQQRGRVVVLFFGFTNCKDVCPTTLAQMKQIKQRLGKDASKVQFVFITVDPGRDTPQVAARYAAGFDPSFIGLSGSEQQLTPVWKAYGVYRKLDKTSPTDANYNVEHSSQLYVIDRSGNLLLTYGYGTATDDMLQDLRYLVR